MSIGSFTIIKNEILWIGPHLQAWLPNLDQMVFFDGNSTDGTLEVIKDYKTNHKLGKKITLVENKDPKDLADDYVKVNNECLRTLRTDLAFFLHPDMFPIKGVERLRDGSGWMKLGANGELAYFVGMHTFAGDPESKIIYSETNRATAWKIIMRLRNPDLGLHYYGHYGASNEDMYFKHITGDSHEYYDTSFDSYPYPVLDSGLSVAHFADVRPLKRRLEKMTNILITQGYTPENARQKAGLHPRVLFKNQDGDCGVKFYPTDWPKTYLDALDAHYKFQERSLVNA